MKHSELLEKRSKMLQEVGHWNKWQVDDSYPLPKKEEMGMTKQSSIQEEKKRYCFDLDGTLCTQTRRADGKPEQNPEEVYRQAKPLEKRIKLVNKLYDEGNTILIDTARGTKHPNMRKDWIKMTESQLEAWGVKYHALRLGVKLVADIYVDDMAQSDKGFFRSADSGYTFLLDKEQDLFK